jgi:hypothetical protein
MIRGRCGDCDAFIDLVAIPMEMGQAAQALLHRSKYCPWCGGHDIFCADPRDIDPEEIPEKLR